MSVEDGLGSDELQEVETPDSPALYNIRLLPIEVACLQSLGKLTVQIELLVYQRQRLVQSLKLRKPDEECFEI